MAGNTIGDARGADVHVALLRGINVGGRNTLPMTVLAALFGEAGCCDVRTYIQSGNVVFRTPAHRVGQVAAFVSGAIAGRFGLQVPVVTRRASDLQAVANANPFLRAGVEERTLHVAFLADLPDAARVTALDPRRSPPDAFVVRGREIYLRCPNGVARSKLTCGYFDAALGTTSTLRNWKTVRHLAHMAGCG